MPIHRNAVVVHCAASGLQYPPLIPVWGDSVITIQPVRAGFPCLAAALIGYVEATREDDAEKNRVCPPSPLSDTPADWALMQTLGGHAALAFNAEADIKGVGRRRGAEPRARPSRTTHRSRFGGRDRALARHREPGHRRDGEACGPRHPRWRASRAVPPRRQRARFPGGAFATLSAVSVWQTRGALLLRA